MKYVVAVMLIRSFVEGVKKAWPKIPEWLIKVIVAALCLIPVIGYDANFAWEVGLASKYKLLDQALSVAALWFITLVGHDIFGWITSAYRTAKEEAKRTAGMK